MAAVLVTELRCSRGEARARVLRAGDLGPRTTLTGQPLSPTHAQLAAAVAVGEVSTAQCDVIIRALGRMPSGLDPAVHDVAEALLVEAARHEGPAALVCTADLLIDRLDPDGIEPREDECHERRELPIAEVRRRDGTYAVHGSLTAESRAPNLTVLEALAASAVRDDVAEPADGDDDGRTMLGLDPRSSAQRRHVAFYEICRRALRGDRLPDAGGVPASLVIYLKRPRPG